VRKSCLCDHRETAHSGRTLGTYHMPTGCTACECPRWTPLGTCWCDRIRAAIWAVITVAAYVQIVLLGAPLWTLGALAIASVILTYAWDRIDTRCVTGRWR